jgi:hypothetical protein
MGIESVLLFWSSMSKTNSEESKRLPFLKGPMKVVQRKNDVYTLRNLVTQREKDYHVKRLHPYYDPNTISPLRATCKDDGERYPIE